MTLKKFTFLKNAAIMTITAFILRGLGIVLRVYLSKKIGAEGMGLYQVILSVYMLSATFATAGVSTASIQVVNDEMAKGTKQTVLKAFKKTLVICICWGLLLAVLLYNLSDFIGKHWINDVRTIPSLKITIFALPFMAATSCIKGYFIAYRRVSIPSEAQILEQIVRLVLIFFIIDYFIPYGIDATCVAIIIGDVISEMSSCGYSYLAYRKEKKRHGNEYLSRNQKVSPVFGKVIKTAGPIALNKYLNTILRTFENILIPETLSKFSSSREKALEQFGLLKGMAMPVLFFPSSLLTAFSTLLIPEMAEAKATGQESTVRTIANKTFKISILVSILIAGIFFTFSYELAELIYGNLEIGRIIKVLAPIVPFMYLETVVMGILQGLNQQIHSLKYNIFDSIIRISLIYAFVPTKGMDGFLLIMILSNITTSSLNVYRSLKVTNTKLDLRNWIIVPLISVTIGIVFMINTVGKYISSTIIYVVCGTLLIIVIYLVLLFVFKSLSLKDFNAKNQNHNHMDRSYHM